MGNPAIFEPETNKINLKNKFQIKIKTKIKNNFKIIKKSLGKSDTSKFKNFRAERQMDENSIAHYSSFDGSQIRTRPLRPAQLWFYQHVKTLVDKIYLQICATMIRIDGYKFIVYVHLIFMAPANRKHLSDF